MVVKDPASMPKIWQKRQDARTQRLRISTVVARPSQPERTQWSWLLPRPSYGKVC